MTTTLNEHACAFAQDQIKNGKVVLDQQDDWSEVPGPCPGTEPARSR
jgi:hypothetical protein